MKGLVELEGGNIRLGIGHTAPHIGINGYIQWFDQYFPIGWLPHIDIFEPEYIITGYTFRPFSENNLFILDIDIPPIEILSRLIF